MCALVSFARLRRKLKKGRSINKDQPGPSPKKKGTWMEEFYYRCKQILEEILTSQGFSPQAEDPAGLGRSIHFTQDDFKFVWLYDLRERMLLLKLEKEGKTVGKGYFYSAKQLQSEFLARLEELLGAAGCVIPERNRRWAVEDLASFQEQAARKGLLSKLFGGTSSK
jgi:hypothetical protein